MLVLYDIWELLSLTWPLKIGPVPKETIVSKPPFFSYVGSVFQMSYVFSPFWVAKLTLSETNGKSPEDDPFLLGPKSYLQGIYVSFREGNTSDYTSPPPLSNLSETSRPSQA